MTYLLPHTVRGPVIRAASSQRGRPHLTSHGEGEERRVEIDGQQEEGTETEEGGETSHLSAYVGTRRWLSPAFFDKFRGREK